MTIDLTPPESVQQAAARGLELRRRLGRGGLSTQEAGAQGIGSGVARAVSLSKGQAQAPDTVRRMKAYFSRHASDKQGKDWSNEERPSNGKIAWLLWGGDPGETWANQMVARLDGGAKKVRVVRKKGA